MDKEKIKNKKELSSFEENRKGAQLLLGIILLLSMLLWQKFVFASENLGIGNRFSGYILLQVEKNGEAWYVNPKNKKRYFLGRPMDAFNLMKSLGIGITNKDLNKIPVGFLDGKDTDQDGLSDNLENALGTDYLKKDTDQDGYNDLEEIKNNYNPLGTEKIGIDKNFTFKNLGKIFLQVEKNGEAWYLNPKDKKRYFLGHPSDAFNLMRKKATGITNFNLNKIKLYTTNKKLNYIENNPENNLSKPNNNPNNYKNMDIMLRAGEAIRNNNKTEAIDCFVPEMSKALEYTMDFLNAEARFTLGNILSGAKLTNSTENKKTYSTEVYFSLGGYKVPINFYAEKQENREWLLTNL